jgi:hypothetical protein
MRFLSQNSATDSVDLPFGLPTSETLDANRVVYVPKLYRRSFFCSPNLDSPRSVAALV